LTLPPNELSIGAALSNPFTPLFIGFKVLFLT
jgi:hypothetical protein